MAYYHIEFGCFQSPDLDEDWLHREGWGKLFCRGCGSRLNGVSAVDIHIGGAKLPYSFGGFGCPDIGFVSQRVLDAGGIAWERFLHLGRIIGQRRTAIRGVWTFTGIKKPLPIRGHAPLDSDLCPECKRLVFIARPAVNRYVVSAHELSDPVYESSEANLVVREDILERIRQFLEKRTRIERLTIEKHGFDGRSEKELEV